MSRDEIARALEALRTQYAGEGDGGDRLVRAVVEYSRLLTPAGQADLHDHLLALVDDAVPGVWPIALEALVRIGAADTAPALADLLGADERSPDWADAVVLAMMRLGSSGEPELLREYVREELRRRHVGVLPLLAWLYRTDLAFALPLAARFFADVLASGRPFQDSAAALRSQIGGQLAGLLASSTGTVLDLLDEVAALDAGAGRALASMIADHLARPDAAAEFGPRAVGALAPAVRLRAAG